MHTPLSIHRCVSHAHYTHTHVYILSAELNVKVPYEYVFIYSGIDLIHPHPHGNGNDNQWQNRENAVGRMSSGRDARYQPYTIKHTHKYDWRKRP